MSGLSPVIGLSLTIPLSLGLYTFASNQPQHLFSYLLTCGTGVLSYLATDKLIPLVKDFTRKAGLVGKDINKKGTAAGEKEIPESLGIVPGTVFILINLIALGYTRFYLSKNLFIGHLSALLSVCFCVFLGFSDDVMDLKWRYKLILPTIASIPLLVAYSGVTDIVVPVLLRPFLGDLVHLGFAYYVFMSSLAVFCTNAINIYAGINGLEVGQSIIIGCSIALHNIIEISLKGITTTTTEGHLFSLMLIIPFIFTSLALLKYNKYPSMVFVGDTYCYFAGMTFAVAGILAHFSKTLLLFFIPQIINFLISLPQLLGFIPIDRHRLPKFDTTTGKLEGQKRHWNLLNVFLRVNIIFVLATDRKKHLHFVVNLPGNKVMCCAIGFGIRYPLAEVFFESNH